MLTVLESGVHLEIVREHFFGISERAQDWEPLRKIGFEDQMLLEVAHVFSIA